MKGVTGILVLVLLALIACSLGGAVLGARIENVAIYAIDSHLDYQKQPVAVLERQMASVQANSPSNAPGFPWAMLLITLGGVALLIANYYERIVALRTAYLKESTKHNRANRQRPAASVSPIRTLTPVQPLNPYNFRPATPPPALPAPSRDDEEGDERW